MLSSLPRIIMILIVLGSAWNAPAQPAQKLNSLYPAWSASGDRIAFCSNSRGNYDIYTMTKDGADIRQITTLNGNAYWPSWIGDKFIVFDADIHGNEEVYRMRANGQRIKRLTFDTIAYDGVTAVSPRTHQIAFDSNRGQDGLADVWIMNHSGKNQVSLTSQPFSQGHPSWSHDESHIVFKMKTNETVHEIFTMQHDGSGMKQITFHESVSQHPSWSPDGSSIIYTSNKDGDFDIYSVDLESGACVKLTDNDYPDYRPSYSPDGKYVLFCSRIDESWQIRRLTISTQEVITLFPR